MTKKNIQPTILKKWENLTLADSFIFSKVMLNEKLCKKIIQEILDIPSIGHIKFLDSERVIDVDINTKSVRLDIYVQDGKNTVYNVEMQVENTGELPQRSRQHQSIIDVDLLDKGDKYIELPNSYVIFICLKDIFKQGLYRYTFMNTCCELPDLKLEDGTQIVFLNTKGTNGDISEDAKAFLDYIEGQTSESDNPFIKELETEVMRIKSNSVWRKQYMRQYLRDKVNRNLTLKEGRSEEKIEIIKTGLTNNIPTETLALLTKLSLEEIEDLKKEYLDE